MNVEKDELNIYEVETLYQELLNELKGDSIVIDMQKVNKIDMSIIQLFISAQKSCIENSKIFALKNVSSELSELFNNSACGFLLEELQ